MRSKHPLYSIWQGMLNRCRNPNAKPWKDYGARGISVCERWKGSFDAFVTDMGPRPEGYTLERRDNNGNYEPGNCKWATQKEQMRNRRVTLFIEVDGAKYTIAELAERSGFKPDTIVARAKNAKTMAELLAPERRTFHEGLRLGGLANGERNRAKTHCKHGHEFTPANTMPNGENGRACRACHNARQRLRQAAKRQIALHE
jgi:hypothetical protein